MNRNLGSVQYNNNLVISRTVKGSSRSKLFKQLGIESLKSRRTFNRLTLFVKLKFTGRPFSLFNLISKSQNYYQSRNPVDIPTWHCKINTTFKHSFVP